MLTIGVGRSDVELKFSEWLRVTRDRAGITQARLSSELGVKPQTISNWENGVSIPALNPDQTLKLCALLNVSLEQLAAAYREEPFKP